MKRFFDGFIDTIKRNEGVLYFLLILFIFAVAAVLRSQEWLSNNFLFLIDQGRDMMAVKGIVFAHHLTLIGPYTSLQGVFQGPLWYYLLAIPILITRGNPLGPQFLMFIISMTTVLTVYLFTKLFFGKKVAAVSTFLFAISPEAVAAATYIWNPHPMWLLIVLYIFTFYLVAIGKNKFQMLLWLLVGLMFNFEAALAFFMLLATFTYFLIFERGKIRTRYFVFGMLLLLMTFSPQILFELRHNFLMTKSVLSLFSGHKQGLLIKGEQSGYSSLIVSHIQTFYNNFLSGFMQFNLLPVLSQIFIVVFIGVGIFAAKLNVFSKNEKKYLSLLFWLAAIVFLLAFLYPFPIRYWFLTGFQTFYILLIGFIVGKLWSNQWLKLIILIVFVLLCFQTLQRINTIYSDTDLGGAAKIKGQEQAIDYIYQDAKGKPFGLFIFTPPVYTFQYDYLLWWYAGPKYHYLPYQEKKGTFYLLMQVDTDQPSSYKGWMETVIKTGKIIYTKTLEPSRFIVQKRQI